MHRTAHARHPTRHHSPVNSVYLKRLFLFFMSTLTDLKRLEAWFGWRLMQQDCVVFYDFEGCLAYKVVDVSSLVLESFEHVELLVHQALC